MSERTFEVLDREGKPYRCDVYTDDITFIIRLYYLRERVGHLYATFSESEAKLNDIHVETEMPIRQFFGLRVRHINKRRQGLGNVMLNLLIKEAYARACSRITGWVIQTDIQETPGLLSWYRRRGFSVSLDNGEPEICYIINS
ncbi:hypothetical protein [Deinococcus alpinitundrae]|uniref:hypothetical protein n=1 Tax=Deinococcus alpinitundrae TaxID=468913 RepID=UPI00137AB85B|nr:hypothetical protein [Deinococcus alpinitundrae]